MSSRIRKLPQGTAFLVYLPFPQLPFTLMAPPVYASILLQGWKLASRPTQLLSLRVVSSRDPGALLPTGLVSRPQMWLPLGSHLAPPHGCSTSESSTSSSKELPTCFKMAHQTSQGGLTSSLSPGRGVRRKGEVRTRHRLGICLLVPYFSSKTRGTLGL